MQHSHTAPRTSIYGIHLSTKWWLHRWLSPCEDHALLYQLSSDLDSDPKWLQVNACETFSEGKGHLHTLTPVRQPLVEVTLQSTNTKNTLSCTHTCTHTHTHTHTHTRARAYWAWTKKELSKLCSQENRVCNWESIGEEWIVMTRETTSCFVSRQAACRDSPSVHTVLLWCTYRWVTCDVSVGVKSLSHHHHHGA